MFTTTGVETFLSEGNITASSIHVCIRGHGNVLSSEPSPPPSFTEQCAGSFLRSGLDFAQFELYDRWFDDNSSLTLAQAGTYNGARDIVCHRGLEPRTVAACRQVCCSRV